MSSEPFIDELIQKLRRDDAERRVLIHAATAELRQKLETVRAKHAEVAPLVDAIDMLARQVAALQLDVQRLREAKSANVVLEREVLEQLQRELTP